eukprot:800643-Pyramimonas_sp.AAC.2
MPSDLDAVVVTDVALLRDRCNFSGDGCTASSFLGEPRSTVGAGEDAPSGNSSYLTVLFSGAWSHSMVSFSASGVSILAGVGSFLSWVSVVCAGELVLAGLLDDVGAAAVDSVCGTA